MQIGEARVHGFACRVEGRGGREKEEKEGEAHRRRAHGMRLWNMDLH